MTDQLDRLPTLEAPTAGARTLDREPVDPGPLNHESPNAEPASRGLADAEAADRQPAGEDLALPAGVGADGQEDLVIDLTSRTLRVQGDIDATNAARLRTSLTYAFELGDPVCVDMSRVSFMGSSGIRALLAAADERRVVILHPSIEVRRVLDMLGLSARFGVTPYR